MFAHILVTTDGSPTSHQALPYAADLARQYQSDLTLLYVAPPPPISYADGALYSLDVAEERELIRLEAGRVLTEAGRLLDVPNLQTVSVEAGGSQVAKVIADEVQRRGVDVVVMGTHGRSGMAKMLLGSVAEALLRRVEVPVLLVRSIKPPIGDHI
ncbi:universal stress protein [Deinococcus rubellus]|uniref:Universal stress protein n=1 Tax=Deinococcus rubellus TaxID=1889240 RepID=A0ABY5YK68_9DEIO|nr:universal stress protein [Deinococcus rubellus]UWX65510.1 universal stress protein [Deinococcus rubellus]